MLHLQNAAPVRLPWSVKRWIARYRKRMLSMRWYGGASRNMAYETQASMTLRGNARHCRQLAQEATQLDAMRKLIRTADEFDREADRLEAQPR